MPILVDTANLFYCIRCRFGSDARLDYAKYLVGSPAIAYVAKYENSESFIISLENQGWDVITQEPRPPKRVDFTVDLTIDAIDLAKKDETIIIGCSDIRLLPLLEYLHPMTKNIIVHAASIPARFKRYAECKEISGNLLQEPIKCSQ